jgi:hypothetical protein
MRLGYRDLAKEKNAQNTKTSRLKFPHCDVASKFIDTISVANVAALPIVHVSRLIELGLID